MQFVASSITPQAGSKSVLVRSIRFVRFTIMSLYAEGVQAHSAKIAKLLQKRSQSLGLAIRQSQLLNARLCSKLVLRSHYIATQLLMLTQTLP